MSRGKSSRDNKLDPLWMTARIESVGVEGMLADYKDDADDLDVGYEGGAGEHLAAVLLEEQHAIDAHFVAWLRVDTVHLDHFAGRDLDLTAAAFNDCEHLYRLLLCPGKTLDYHGKGLRLKA